MARKARGKRIKRGAAGVSPRGWTPDDYRIALAAVTVLLVLVVCFWLRLIP
jgi:hypothetical protein